MAQSSVQTKSLLLPVVVATYGYALTQKSVSVSLLGIAAVLLFGYIDASYLRQEQAYRRLYNAVIEGTKEIPLLSLNPSCVDKVVFPVNADLNLTEDTEPVCEEKSFWKKSGEVIKEWVFLGPKVWLSWSIFPFYFGFFVVGCAVMCHALMSGC